MKAHHYGRPLSSNASYQPFTVNQTLVNSPTYTQIHVPRKSSGPRYSKPWEKENDKLKNEVKAL